MLRRGPLENMLANVCRAVFLIAMTTLTFMLSFFSTDANFSRSCKPNKQLCAPKATWQSSNGKEINSENVLLILQMCFKLRCRRILAWAISQLWMAAIKPSSAGFQFRNVSFCPIVALGMRLSCRFPHANDSWLVKYHFALSPVISKQRKSFLLNPAY